MSKDRKIYGVIESQANYLIQLYFNKAQQMKKKKIKILTL